MKLSDLQPRFVRYEERDGSHWHITVGRLADAQGVEFLCPKCFVDLGLTDVGCHWCQVTFRDRGAADNMGSHGADGNPTRWTVSGTGAGDLTLTPSIQLVGGCAWHGFITNGQIINA